VRWSSATVAACSRSLVDAAVELGEVVGGQRPGQAVEQLGDLLAAARPLRVDDGDEVVGVLQLLVVLEDHQPQRAEGAVRRARQAELGLAVDDGLLVLRAAEAEGQVLVDVDAVHLLEPELALRPLGALLRAGQHDGLVRGRRGRTAS
jgi:hypothetical protein